MLAYKMNLSLAVEKPTVQEVPAKRGEGTKLRRCVEEAVPDWEKFNQKMGRNKKVTPISIFAYQATEDGAMLSMLSRGQVLTASEAEGLVRKSVRAAKMSSRRCLVTEFQEITLTEFCNTLVAGDVNGLVSGGYRIYGELGLSGIREQLETSRRRDSCQMKEYIPRLNFASKRGAMAQVKEIMGDRSLTEELKRIYAPCNTKSFVGHPVHYFIRAASQEAAKDMIDTLVTALYANRRVSSKRITYFGDYEPCGNMEQSFQAMLSHAGNSSMVIELTGKEQSGRGRLLSGERTVAEFMTEEIRKHCQDTLFLLVEIMGKSSQETVSSIMSSLRGVIDLVPISEGTGNEVAARAYLNYRAKCAGRTAFHGEELEKVVPKGKYTPTMVLPFFHTLSQERMRKTYYPAYQDISFYKNDSADETAQEEAYETKINKLIGLEEPKAMIKRLLAVRQMRKTRQELSLKDNQAALHMVFTGNPGSAKTTVARMLAGLLKEKQLLSTGAFVECGRGDLVGRYVGWTAKTVQKRFQDAAGGVLFIDEAYSLLDDSNSFGTEAINTIVQEMENHRDDVLVIFAGYPDKMRDFIDSNEGLRSRIAAYIDFPDYNVEEMVQILRMMARERGLRLNEGILKKCRGYFGEAIKKKNFGNGRYVRNLLEAAVMRQAERLANEGTGKITRQKASCLTVADFVPVKVDIKKEKKRHVGFFAMSSEAGEE